MPDMGMLFLNILVRRTHLISDSLNEASSVKHAPGCIPFDQSESGFFNRKLDQIADQLEHKIRKWICFHTEVPGSRLP